jgi:hypothetical protein
MSGTSAYSHLVRLLQIVQLCVDMLQDAPTIEEYLELFDAPISIDLDSERVWPMPVPVR